MSPTPSVVLTPKFGSSPKMFLFLLYCTYIVAKFQFMKAKQILFTIIAKAILIRNTVCILFFTLLPFISSAQRADESAQYDFEKEIAPVFELKSFTCKSTEGKVYIRWTVIEPSDECMYVVERSLDNKKYSIIHSERSFKSPNGSELLNSFVDDKPLGYLMYYRIRRFSSENVIHSKVVIVNGVTIRSSTF